MGTCRKLLIARGRRLPQCCILNDVSKGLLIADNLKHRTSVWCYHWFQSCFMPCVLGAQSHILLLSLSHLLLSWRHSTSYAGAIAVASPQRVDTSPLESCCVVVGHLFEKRDISLENHMPLFFGTAWYSDEVHVSNEPSLGAYLSNIWFLNKCLRWDGCWRYACLG